jgi:hypothetical protein
MPKGVNYVDQLFEAQLIDEATMRLLINCKLAVYKHLQVNNRDINPEDITFCGTFLPSANAILRHGDDLFVAELTDDRAHIEVRQFVNTTCSVCDVL